MIHSHYENQKVLCPLLAFLRKLDFKVSLYFKKSGDINFLNLYTPIAFFIKGYFINLNILQIKQ